MAWTKPHHITRAACHYVVNEIEQIAAILSANRCFHDGAAASGDAGEKPELIDDVLKFHGIGSRHVTSLL